MKVLHLSTFENIGGASRATTRLHQGLNNVGIDSWMLVSKKFSNDPKVIEYQGYLRKLITKINSKLNYWPLKAYTHTSNSQFSPQWTPDLLTRPVKQIDPDIINLNWISNGYLKIETISNFQKPIVWTLSDMWSFTGGCYYSQECDRYLDSCGACPILRSHNKNDLSSRIWQRKAKAWENIELTIVSPSSWLANCARSSSLFKNCRIEVIPCGLDTEIYQPTERKIARKILHLPEDKQLILFGALDATKEHRKGFHLLQPALKSLSQYLKNENVELCIFGASQAEKPPDLGFKVRFLGQVKEDIRLALIYSAADVMIVPSIQEAFGQTASESMACGTPVVAFNATGLMDIVDHQQNGYLAQPYQIEDLAQGIAWILEDRQRHQKLSIQARKKAEREFAMSVQANRYLSLFQKRIAVA